MNSTEKEIQLHTDLPNVLCSIIYEYTKIKIIPLDELKKNQKWNSFLDNVLNYTSINYIAESGEHYDIPDTVGDIKEVYYFADNILSDRYHRWNRKRAVCKTENFYISMYEEYISDVISGVGCGSKVLNVSSSLHCLLNQEHELYNKFWQFQSE